MISIRSFFIVLATSLAKGTGSTQCNFSELTGGLCFGTVGKQLIFYLPDTDIRVKKDNTILIFKKSPNTPPVYGESNKEVVSFTNGTLKLGKATKEHAGNYTLEEFGSSGTLVKRVNVLLKLHAPLLKPVVSQMCLSPEKMIITCFSEGDEVVFSLTLNEVLLVQTRGQSQCQRHWSSNVQPLSFNDSQNKNNCINFMLDLQKQPIGQVICHVWNNVSQNDAFIQLTLCKDLSSVHDAAVAVTATITTTVLFVLLFWGVKHLQPKSRLDDVNEGVTEDETHYSTVFYMKRPGRN